MNLSSTTPGGHTLYFETHKEWHEEWAGEFYRPKGHLLKWFIWAPPVMGEEAYAVVWVSCSEDFGWNVSEHSLGCADGRTEAAWVFV